MSTPLANVILRGARVSQPGADTVCEGSLYYVTDEQVTERSDGVVWASFTDAGDSGIVAVESTILTSDQTTHVFSALDGNTEQIYILIGRIKNNSGATCRYDWRPNGLTTNQASFRGATLFTTLILGQVADTGFVTFEATISSQANPNSIAYPRTYTGFVSEVTTVPVASGGTIGGIWTNTATNITSIEVAASVANGLGNGSTLALLRLT